MSDSTPEERSKRISELEARLARRPTVGVMPPVAALALLGALGTLYLQRDDLAYFFSVREPISLGAEGDYHFERAVSNRCAEVHGTPALRGAYGLDRNDEHFVVVGLQFTPLLVKRRALSTEEWRPGTTPPPPDQRPFAAQGRLLSRQAATRWADAFTKHDGYGGPSPQWLLIEGARPGSDLGTIAWFGVLLAFAAINLWLLVRGLLAFARR